MQSPPIAVSKYNSAHAVTALLALLSTPLVIIINVFAMATFGTFCLQVDVPFWTVLCAPVAVCSMFIWMDKLIVLRVADSDSVSSDWRLNGFYMAILFMAIAIFYGLQGFYWGMPLAGFVMLLSGHDLLYSVNRYNEAKTPALRGKEALLFAILWLLILVSIALLIMVSNFPGFRLVDEWPHRVMRDPRPMLTALVAGLGALHFIVAGLVRRQPKVVG